MSVTVSVPDDIAAMLGSSDEDRQLRVREVLAIGLYREGKISLRMMGELAGVGSDYWAAEELLAKHHTPLSYSPENLDADREAAEKYLNP